MTLAMMKPSPLDIAIGRDDAGVQVTAAGELDLATSPRLEDELQAVLGGGLKRLVVDLSALTFVDSSGLRLLISLNDRAQREGWQLCLVPPADSVRMIFRISGAEEHLPFVIADGDGRAAERGDASAGGRQDGDAPLVGEGLS